VTVVAAIAVITMLTSGAAMAAPMPYAELDAGALLDGQLHAKGADIFLGAFDLKEKHRVGGIFSGLVGRRIGDTPFAVEGEGLYLNSAIQSDDLNAALGASAGLRVQSYGGMANLKVEHPLASAPGGFTLSPFATGGVGYGQTDMTILGDHYAGGGLLWQAKAGLALRTSAAVSWTLAYRYVHIPGYDTNKLGLVARLENYADGVSVGVRYTFGAH
jgi:opacity protein-like surface antigen